MGYGFFGTTETGCPNCGFDGEVIINKTRNRRDDIFKSYYLLGECPKCRATLVSQYTNTESLEELEQE